VIRKLRYEVLPGYWIPALLYEPLDVAGAVPVVLNPNGHHAGGKALTYKQARCANLARRGMIALNFEFIGMGELGGDADHNWIALFDAAGTSGAGIFYLAMSKALDILLAHEHADATRVAMTGLSGGGWQTIVLSALDTRITASIPVAGYTSLRNQAKHPVDIGDLEQVPPDLGTTLDYPDMTAMLAPRPALIILNDQDDCAYRTDRTRRDAYDVVRPVYAAFGAEDKFEFHNNTDPGTHNYDADNRSQLHRFLARHFGMDFPHTDLHTDDEILSEAELNVGLPEEQLSLGMVSRRLARRVVGTLTTPQNAAQGEALRERLRHVLRLRTCEAHAVETSTRGDRTVYRLEMGPWAWPVVVTRASSSDGTTVVIGDDKRTSAEAAQADAGTVVTAHVLNTGALQEHVGYQVLVQACGERLLGIQVGQILAVVRFAMKQTAVDGVRLVGHGLKGSVACLIAAALEPSLFVGLTTHECPGSLLELYDRRLHFDDAYPVACPDLLATADIAQIAALLDGFPYSRPDRRVKDILIENE